MDALRAWRNTILFPDTDLATDTATLLGAKHLILSTSTFAKGLALMSTRLERVYLPRAIRGNAKDVLLAPPCCYCRGHGTDREAHLPKAWGCGAERGWPRPEHARNTVMVEVMLPGYQIGGCIVLASLPSFRPPPPPRSLFLPSSLYEQRTAPA